jgi:multisubunit Na+/H+ antiporter MnhC subunit
MLAPPAWAYLDPSTGSMILSAIVGLFATLALAVKTYWYKLKSLFRRDTQRESAPIEEQAAESESPTDR